MIMRLFALAAASLTLAACSTTNGLPTTVGGGECQAFERPPYAVEGKTAYDQRVVNGFVETGVAACKWARPAARPPEIEARPAVRAVAKAAPAKRPGIFKRIRQRAAPSVSAAPAPAPVAAVPYLATPSAASVAPPAAAPRDRVDELLRPNPLRRVY